MNIKEADTAISLKEAITHAQLIAEGECGCDCLYQHDCIVDWLEELQQYRKAKAEGRLEVFPCPVGGEVWLNADDEPCPVPCTVISYNIRNGKGGRHVRLSSKKTTVDWLLHDHESYYYKTSLASCGKTWFLTPEEAKAARSAKSQSAK